MLVCYFPRARALELKRYLYFTKSNCTYEGGRTYVIQGKEGYERVPRGWWQDASGGSPRDSLCCASALFPLNPSGVLVA